MATIQAAIVTPALRELGIVDITATPGAELSALALSLLNRILDEWNAERGAVYADVHSALFAFTPNLNPHTIGVSGDSPTWAITGHRPVSIEGIRITTDDGETYLAPLTARDAAWWHARSSPGTTSAYPTDFYYNQTQPKGSIYFYPEPSSASVKAQLWYRIPLTVLALTDTFSMPPGYQAALHETLKEKLAELPMFASASSPVITAAATKARAIAFANNRPVPQFHTADLGLGGAGRVYRHETGPFSLLRHG